MTITVPVAIADPALPLADPADRATFTARKLEHLRWEKEVLSPGVLALGTASYNNALDAQASATQVAADKLAVAANATAVATYANAPAWVTATNYVIDDVRRSPIDGRIYLCWATATGRTTDPSADPSYWKPVNTERPLIAVTTSTVTCVAGFDYDIRYAGVCTITLPASPTNGDMPIGLFFTNNRVDAVIAPGSNTINGTAGNMTYDTQYSDPVFRFVNSQWRFRK